MFRYNSGKSYYFDKKKRYVRKSSAPLNLVLWSFMIISLNLSHRSSHVGGRIPDYWIRLTYSNFMYAHHILKARKQVPTLASFFLHHNLSPWSGKQWFLTCLSSWGAFRIERLRHPLLVVNSFERWHLFTREGYLNQSLSRGNLRGKIDDLHFNSISCLPWQPCTNSLCTP